MADLLTCTAENIKNHFGSDNSCAFVGANCQEQHEYLDFISFYYCTLDRSVPLVVVMSIAVVAFVFNFLGTTADTYLAPALEVITKRLRLSEAVAGVTLLALANGATDVIAGLVAGTKSTGGIEIAIGGLFGACLFTVTIVLARCIDGAGQIKVDAQGLKRDIFFLLFATVYFLILTVVGKYASITWPMASGFFVIYIIFIVYVIFSERSKTKRHAEYKNKLQRVKARLLKKDGKDETQPAEEGDSPGLKNLWDQVLTPYLLKSIIRRRKVKGFGRNLSKNFDAEKLAEGDISADIEKAAEEAKKEEAEEEKTTFDKVMDVYNAPLLFVRNLTMPPFEEENWNPWFAAAAPICGPLFFIWEFDLLEDMNEHWFSWAIFAAITVPISLFLLIKGRKENLAENHSGKLAAAAFVVAALWLNLIAGCFMDFLSLITVISGLPLTYLSLTMLAWGNSLDDFFIDYVISKAGQGKMAVTGVYGGQLFNLLIGFGGAMFLQALLNNGVNIHIYNFSTPELLRANVLTCVLLAATVIGLISTLLVGKLRNWVLGKKMMWFLMIFYGGFLVVVTIITFTVK